jgi:hypothetical protein
MFLHNKKRFYAYFLQYCKKYAYHYKAAVDHNINLEIMFEIISKDITFFFQIFMIRTTLFL